MSYTLPNPCASCHNSSSSSTSSQVTLPDMVPISKMPIADKLTGYEEMEIIQNGTNKKVALSVVGQSISSIITRKYTFPSSLVWKVKHNLKPIDFTVTLRDQFGTLLFTSVTPINNNEFWIQFTEPEEGTASIIFNVG